MCNKLYTHLDRALNKACPLRKETKRDPNNKWYNEELAELHEEVVKAHSKFKKFKSPRDKILYNKLNKTYKYRCRKAQKEDWQTFKARTPDIKN